MISLFWDSENEAEGRPEGPAYAASMMSGVAEGLLGAPGLLARVSKPYILHSFIFSGPFITFWGSEKEIE